MKNDNAAIWVYLDDECFSFLRRELINRKSWGRSGGATYGEIIMDLLNPYIYGCHGFDARYRDRLPAANRSMKHRRISLPPEWHHDFLSFLEKQRRAGEWPDNPYYAVSCAIHEAMECGAPGCPGALES